MDVECPKHVPSTSEGSEVRSPGRWDAGILIPGLRTSHFGLVLALVGGAAGRPLAAQVPTPTIDTLPSDSARTDSLRRESTDRLLAAEALTAQRVPMLPALGGEGPRAAGWCSTGGPSRGAPRRTSPTS